MENILTVEQAAEILNLHPKTVARFINESKIIATKIGRQWRVKEKNLRSFIEKNTGSSENKIETVEDEFHSETILKKPEETIQISTVVNINVKSENEASRISNSIIAMLNCKDPMYGDSTYKFIYYPNLKKARFLLWGSPLFISHIMDIFSTMYTNEISQ